MTDCSCVMAILQENRVETATKVQEVLTEFGCHIRLRLGLHDAALGACSNTGIILLQLCADDAVRGEMEKKLQAIATVKVKAMSLNF